MTYCVAAAIDSGIVFASDSRTNAGLDNVAVHKKMHVYEVAGERVVVLLSAGNLGSAQKVRSMLRQGAPEANVLGLKSMAEVANLVGEALREVVGRDGPMLSQQNIDPGCTFIVGGQIAGEAPRLFHVYPQGNFIESSEETRYFQIGETKYGKPIIDRVVQRDTPLAEVAKCLLVSFDSTMRSNLSVGLPIDLLAYEADALRVTRVRRFEQDDPFFRDISRIWSAGLRKAFAEVPEVSWS
jgi:putative proteasome-type protease